MDDIIEIPMKRQEFCIKYGYKKTAWIDGKIEGKDFYWGGKPHTISKHVKVRYLDTPEGEYHVSSKTAYNRYISKEPKRDLVKSRIYRDPDFDKKVYTILNIKQPISQSWHLTYGITESRKRRFLEYSHSDSLKNPKSETALTLFVLGNVDGWEQINKLRVPPRSTKNNSWSKQFFDNIRKGVSNFQPNENKINHIWDAILDPRIYRNDRSALNNSYLLFEFEIMNSQFHSIDGKAFKKLSFFDIDSKTEWSQFDAVLILPTIKRFVFIESKLDSDMANYPTTFPINQICRNLESAYLLTNHDRSLYRDWDFYYLFISPSSEYQSGLKNYERILSIFINEDYNSIENQYNKTDESNYFNSFYKNISKHVHRLYWDQIGEKIYNKWPDFYIEYLNKLNNINNEWKKIMGEKFRKVGLT